MRAQVLRGIGGAENFQLTDIPRPEVSRGMVLVRVIAASINQIDIKIRTGLPIGPAAPMVLGCDMAGIVAEVGPGVLDFSVGDEVYGCVGGVSGQGGTLAEYVLADGRLLAPKPSRLSMREAAALPLVSLTAWDGLERTDLSSSDHLLVQGGGWGRWPYRAPAGEDSWFENRSHGGFR